jgi:hypothetical protein
MSPPQHGRDGKSRARPEARPRPEATTPTCKTSRQQTGITPPTVTQSIPDRLGYVQDDIAELAHLAAVRAWASERADWTRAASHMHMAAHHVWLAAEALADWGIVS